jgi:hypothetical protein
MIYNANRSLDLKSDWSSLIKTPRVTAELKWAPLIYPKRKMEINIVIATASA